MHKAIFVKDASHQGSIGQGQFICLVSDRLISFVQQLKLDKGFFFQKLRKEAGGGATARRTNKGVGGSSSNRRSACRLGADVGNVFTQPENMRSPRRYGIAPVNWAGINISYQSHGH